VVVVVVVVVVEVVVPLWVVSGRDSDSLFHMGSHALLQLCTLTACATCRRGGPDTRERNT
jgi:hypothetical protein